MKTMHGITAICASLLILSAPLGAASKFYKWVDDNGVTHYTQSPPPDGVSGKEVRTSTKASSDQEEELEDLEMRRKAAAEERAEDAKRQADQVSQQPSAEDKAAMEKRCAQAKANLETLRNKPIVRQENPETGELEVVDENKRAELIRTTEAALNGCP